MHNFCLFLHQQWRLKKTKTTMYAAEREKKQRAKALAKMTEEEKKSH